MFLSRKKELRQLSKNQLIEIILSLEERINTLEHYLKAFDNPHTPPSKQLKKNTPEVESESKSESEESSEDEKKKPRFPGKPLGSNGGGIKLLKPDKIEEHTLDISPISSLPLGKPIGYRVQTIIDFPDKPIQTIEHRFMQYADPKTGEIVEAKNELPNCIYGKNLQSIVIMLKNLTNSHNKIASFIRELGAPSFSHKTVQNIASVVISKLENDRNIIAKEIRNEPFIHADETTMRRDGKNGYIWTICTKLRAIFLAAKGRAKSNIIKLLRNFKGVLIVDGYGGYAWYPLKQRCWAHLIREFKDYAERDEEINIQFQRLQLLYEKLKKLNAGPPDEKEIAKGKWTLNDIVECLRTINGTKKLRIYIENGGDDWFTALYYPGVPLDNNHAERELRPLVLLRKTIGCYRNWKGKRWIDVVISVLHTWKLQGKNIFHELGALSS